MNVMQIMTPAPACCVPDDRLSDVAALMVEYDCGGIPVVESVERLKPIGVITDRDIACRAVTEGNSALEKTVADYMSSPCVAVTPEASVRTAAKYWKNIGSAASRSLTMTVSCVGWYPRPISPSMRR